MEAGGSLKILLDTSVLIDILKGRPETIGKIEGLKNRSEFYTSSVNVYEILRGIRSIKVKVDQKAHTIAFDTLLVNLKVLNFDIESSEKASWIYSDLKQKGIKIDENDYLIAGIYLSNGIDAIITRDRHFESITQLKTIRC